MVGHERKRSGSRHRSRRVGALRDRRAARAARHVRRRQVRTRPRDAGLLPAPRRGARPTWSGWTRARSQRASAGWPRGWTRARARSPPSPSTEAARRRSPRGSPTWDSPSAPSWLWDPRDMAKAVSMLTNAVAERDLEHYGQDELTASATLTARRRIGQDGVASRRGRRGLHPHRGLRACAVQAKTTKRTPQGS